MARSFALVIDSSNANPITVSELKRSGAKALISKATEGSTFKDKDYAWQRNVAKQAGVPFGAYVFLQSKSPGNEAKQFLEWARPRKGDIQPIIDAEDLTYGVAALARRANACAKALEANGYAPILYASSSVWLKMIRVVPELVRLKVWEAQYPGKFTRWSPWLLRKRIKLHRGVHVAMWQWTDRFAVGTRHFDASVIFDPIHSLLI